MAAWYVKGLVTVLHRISMGLHGNLCINATGRELSAFRRVMMVLDVD